MFHKVNKKVYYGLTLAVVVALLLAPLALADNVQNDVASTAEGKIVTVTAGDSVGAQVGYRIAENSGDGQGGCNASDGSPVNVTPTGLPTGVTKSPSSLNFTVCSATYQYITFIAAASAAPGDYPISATASDSGPGSYNTSPAGFTLRVLPAPVTNTAPSLILPADMTVEGNTLGGANVVFSVTATDAEDDPDPTPSCSPASNSFFALGGPHTVNCSVTDSGGLTTNGSFKVTVVDTTAPMIAAHGDETAEATSAAGAVVSYSSPETSDVVDGPGFATCEPASDSTFPLGDTTVTCDAIDAAGNSALATTFKVSVVDTTPPVIAPHADVTAEATSAAGAVVNYTPPTTSDAVDGEGTATCTPASGNTFALGDTTVTCNVVDGAGNPAIATTFKVSVVDTTPPVIAPHADVVAEATSAAGAVVNYTPPATSDAVDGEGTATCAPASGSTFPLGNTAVTCDASDAAGNAATPTTFTVKVQYGFDGFFRPIDNLPVLNVVKAGSAIPVKFSLGGNMGLNIFAAGYPGSAPIACDATAPVDAVEATVTAGASSLSYDAASDLYTYVWKTDKSWTACRQLVVKLNDGTTHIANFKFNK